MRAGSLTRRSRQPRMRERRAARAARLSSRYASKTTTTRRQKVTEKKGKTILPIVPRVVVARFYPSGGTPRRG